MSEATSVPLARARDELADIANRAAYGGERVILTRRGRPVAAVIPAGDLDLLEELEEERDGRLAEEAAQEGGWATLEEVQAKLGLPEDPEPLADEDDGLDANWHGAPVELGDR